ncbi:hypothetical protein O181_092538 [Austropuccinia psidii MF-1]|uniref:Integrase catalytic domain-containing protein n=1 Tax=Austropuccinia psidii MF-1 TaxID=1389203 RepID=A0A9Q3IZG7_9BASI|nr:hypothetical protein [Austropuccinia psidii MF-1]
MTPKALQTNNTREFTLASFTNALAKLGIIFFPSLPYSPQENGKAERLNWTLGDMAQAMTVQSGMPERFWKFAYSLAAFLCNCLPNSRCLKSSPHQELFRTAPSIATLYPFRGDQVQAAEASNVGRLAAMGAEYQQNGSVSKHHLPSISTFHELVKTHFQGVTGAHGQCEVPTECLFAPENQAVDSLTLVKDVNIHEHLGQALLGPHHEKWREACLAELDQMATRDIWEAVEKKPGVKTIGHRLCRDIRADCFSHVTPFGIGHCCPEELAGGAYLYSPVEETVLIEPLVDFLPELRGKALRLKKALYGMQQADKISDFKTALCAKLDIQWSDKVQQIVGLECAIGEGEVSIAQRRLTDNILQAGIAAGFTPVGSLRPDEDTLDPTPFRFVIGSLAYLVRCPLTWGGDLERSQTGFMIKLGNTPILWGSKRQSMVALSTCAAEYIALSDLTQHLVQVINQLGQLTGNFDKAIYCNNQAAVQVLIDNKSRKRMNYLDRTFFLSTIPLGSTTSSSSLLRHQWLMVTIFGEGVDIWFSSCNLNTAHWPHQNSFPHLLPFGGDGKGTYQRASFATFRHFSLGNASLPTSYHLEVTEKELTGEQSLLHLGTSH